MIIINYKVKNYNNKNVYFYGELHKILINFLCGKRSV